MFAKFHMPQTVPYLPFRVGGEMGDRVWGGTISLQVVHYCARCEVITVVLLSFGVLVGVTQCRWVSGYCRRFERS
jgi:hypothetical protein